MRLFRWSVAGVLCAAISGSAWAGLAAGVIALASGSSMAQESPASRIKDLTCVPTRLVWIRGSDGKGAAFGPTEQYREPVYRVVALDTEDGGRERILVSDPDTHSRPLITPSGQRVLWSDMEGNISIIDWNGRNRKVLLPRLGFACGVGVAEDPPGTEWVYVGEGRASEGFNAIFRYQIDNPQKKEVVWDKSPSIDSWGFTRDGKSGASRFPSYVGSVTLPNGELKLVGQIGCTPGLSGDGSMVSHMQVITHAGVYIYDRDGSNRRFIDFRQGPPSEGLGPGEFWWTQFAHYDSRFITFAGPFQKLAGFTGNIYFCQLNDRRDAFTTWVRVTNDGQVNTHPYAWLAPPGDIFLDAAVSPNMSGEAKEPMTVAIRNEGDKNWKGEVTVTAPEGWNVDPPRAACQVSPGAKQAMSFRLIPPAAVRNGKATFTALLKNLAGKPVSRVSATTLISPSSAAFVKQDAKTQGNWKGVYGAGGYSVLGDKTDLKFASITAVNNVPATWNNNTTDVRGLLKADGGDRLASCWAGQSFTVDVSLTDKKERQVALYWLDWDATNRTQTIEVLDPATDSVLDTRTISDFREGRYLVWKIKGRVIFKITLDKGPNAVLSGLFFD